MIRLGLRVPTHNRRTVTPRRGEGRITRVAMAMVAAGFTVRATRALIAQRLRKCAHPTMLIRRQYIRHLRSCDHLRPSVEPALLYSSSIVFQPCPILPYY